jgi:RNA polymerase sigma-70 factor (ECF subfamily)
MRPSDRGPADVPEGQAGEPGDPQALEVAEPPPTFKDAYTTTFRRVWRLLRRLGIPEADHVDIAQEAFLRVSQELNTRDPTVDLVAWIFKLTNHAATRHRRLARNRRELLANEAENLAGYRADTRLIEGIARWEYCRLVDHLVQSIEDGDVRLVFVMHELEQMPMAEITQALGIPRRTARDRLTKGRERFEAAVNALHPDDREVLGVRRSRVLPFVLLDLARLAEAERTLDQSIAAIQAQIWERLQERMRAGADRGRAPHGAGRRALGRIPSSATQALGAALVVFVAGAVVGSGLFADRPLFASESEAPASIGPDVVMSRATTTPAAGATVTPAGSTPGAMSASWAGTVPRRSAPQAAPASSRAAGIPRAGPDLGDDDETLIDRARANLDRSTPQPDLTIASLRLHAQKYPNSARAHDREALLGRALALAAQAKPHAAAGAITNSTAGDGP